MKKCKWNLRYLKGKLQTHKMISLNWTACKAFSHTYRADFSCFSWSKSCLRCSCDFAHRLQSFASNWHFLFVVVIVAFLLTHKQFVWVAGEVWGALSHVFLGWMGSCVCCCLCGCCCICCMLFNFMLSCCCSLFSFLTASMIALKYKIDISFTFPGR